MAKLRKSKHVDLLFIPGAFRIVAAYATVMPVWPNSMASLKKSFLAFGLEKATGNQYIKDIKVELSVATMML